MGPPPLKGIRVLEFAGLAPGPFTGLLLADYGASVLRIDRAISPGKGPDQPPVASDLLTRHKTSIAVNLKSTAGLQLIHALIQDVDVLIDPWRPRVLEKLGLAPETLLQLNDRLVIGRITGFRRDGKFALMAGHDINYIAVSGVLSMLGKAKSLPSAPGNLLGDFAGGGAMCFMGILLALLSRATTGKGQVVESNMVDGSAYIATMPRLALKTPLWNQERGKNLLDGGCPYYDCYLTKDNKYMAVGALEPLFFTELLKGLSIEKSALSGNREDPGTWPELRRLFTSTFKSKSQSEWEQIFDGTDACCTPVRTHGDLEQIGFDQRPPVTLRDSPGLSISKNQTNSRPVHEGQGPGVNGEGWYGHVLKPDTNGEVLLQTWTGWKKGRDYQDVDGGLVRLPAPRL